MPSIMYCPKGETIPLILFWLRHYFFPLPQGIFPIAIANTLSLVQGLLSLFIFLLI